MSADNWWAGPPSIPALNPAGLRKRLEWALSVFRQRGVTLADDCRANRALRVLSQLSVTHDAGTGQQEPLNPELFVAHQRTALELFLVALATAQCNPTQSPFTRPKLQTIVRGPACKEGRDRSARNTQFELLTAARFVLGGVAVRAGEPDMIIRFGTESVGVAAKRVTSLSDSQIRKRVHEAIRQIERTPHRGIVAVNLEARIKPVPKSASTAELLQNADAAFQVIGDLANQSVNNSRVLGMIAIDSLVRASEMPSPNEYPSLEAATPIRYWITGTLLDQMAGLQFVATWRNRWLGALLRASADFSLVAQ